MTPARKAKPRTGRPIACISHPPSMCPTVDTLISKQVVTKALQDAWNDSFPSDDICREQGGYIYAEIDSNKKLISPLNLSITRADAGRDVKQKEAKGDNPEIDLNKPKVPTDTSKSWLLVANFHTHPLDSSVGGNDHPSKADHNNAYDRLIPSIVVSRAGAFQYGILERENKTNPTTYPPVSSGVTIRSAKKTSPQWTPTKAPHQYTPS
ncbi:hypothetical protein GALMADRAFT_146853 [Galerina marginata CBS 339.88]|uniref:JAB domain-containing protein n=1 Tax=Galerina marginata (strain CBS 339.88) TaxID=685588 RepID=A0A067SAC0_GALM3|nr:hypothetical protein GALMADRAFT_146853 [Galerina marginata CBS 339.88]